MSIWIAEELRPATPEEIDRLCSAICIARANFEISISKIHNRQTPVALGAKLALALGIMWTDWDAF